METDLTKYTRINVRELKDGKMIKSKFAVREKSLPRKYSKGYFFEILLGDESGEIKAKYWGGNDKERVMEIYNSFETGDVIEVIGLVSFYQDRLEIGINEGHIIRKCKEIEYEISDFLPKTKKNVEEMFNELNRIRETIKNEYLKALLNEFFEDEEFVKKFKEMPASIYHHHNFIGGYLEHIYNVVKICQTICNIYKDLNKELLLCCAILHDAGKILEYKYKTSIEYTTEGSLIGNTVLSEREVRKKMDSIDGFPEELKRKVSHIVLSHHGKSEWGSAIEPRIKEALALHLADNLDAKLQGFLQIIEQHKDSNEEVVKDNRYGYIYLK